MTDKSETYIIDKVCARKGVQVLDSHNFRGDQTVTLNKEAGLAFFEFLRDDPDLAFDMLMDLTVVDYMRKKSQRFEVVYHFYSTKHNHRLRIKLPVDEKDCTVTSLTPLWRTANWYEREAWDLYGVKFEGHPNLRRILLYDEFKGHPLRKDYPVNKRQPLIGPLN
ncbi:MAG: NADH-quinone oxidoreductase subunit C [Nitrospinae bacterium CG11_big_fil_rev_8_21_14_0_20_56_8]|nr:MAG: NADH-quinone oxidoreductase subunit C [Nitrospinae bacterium CG11_big_fil_rev_8_21_14_0_20_56_8]